MAEETRVFQKDFFFYEVESGRSVRVFDEFLIGREECHWNISNDPSVSRQHVKITVDENRVYITDLNTKNKTLLNGKAIEPGMKYLLNVGDDVEIGNHRFVFRNQENGTSPAPNDVPAAARISEQTPPRLPMVERPRDVAPIAPYEGSASILSLQSQEPEAPAPSEPDSNRPILSAELELAKISDSSPSVSLVSPMEAPPPFANAARTVPGLPDVRPDIAPLKAVIIPPPPPSRISVKSAAAAGSEEAKEASRFHLLSFMVSLGYVAWSHLEDFQTASTLSQPDSLKNLLSPLGIAVAVASLICFLPSWWVARKGRSRFVRMMLLPTSGAAFVFLVSALNANLGYDQARDQIRAQVASRSATSPSPNEADRASAQMDPEPVDRAPAGQPNESEENSPSYDLPPVSPNENPAK